jgi:hypothetical protein
VFTGLENNSVNGIFVKIENSRRPSNAVTFGDGQNDTLDLFSAIVGMHEDRAMVFGEPVIACFTAQQKGLVFSIPCACGNVPFASDPMVCTFCVWAKMFTEIGHHILLSIRGFVDITLKGGRRQEKTNND